MKKIPKIRSFEFGIIASILLVISFSLLVTAKISRSLQVEKQQLQQQNLQLEQHLIEQHKIFEALQQQQVGENND